MRRWGALALAGVLFLAACATTRATRDTEPDGPVVDQRVFDVSAEITAALAEPDHSCNLARQRAHPVFVKLAMKGIIDPVYMLRCEKDDAGWVLSTDYMIIGNPNRQITLVRMFGP
jgi:hypothetical protein